MERTLTMSFKDIAGKKHSISIKDVKEEILEEEVLNIMDGIIGKKLIKTAYGDLVEKTTAQVVTKEVDKFTME